MKRTPVKIRNLYLPNKALDKTMEEYRWRIVFLDGHVCIYRTNDSGKGIFQYVPKEKKEFEIATHTEFTLAGRTRRQARYQIHKWFDYYEVTNEQP